MTTTIGNESSRIKKGDRYVVDTPFRALVPTTWRAPFTGGSEKTLPTSLQFIVDFDPPSSATAVSASAEPYEQWERILVDAEDLRADKYGGYYLVISFASLKEHCRRLSNS
jgi:hypothetical protein